MADNCIVQVSSAPRGLTSGPTATFVPVEAVLTWSWGLQPATAIIEWASAQQMAALVPGSGLKISLGGHDFYGLTDNAVSRNATDGFSLVQEFRDNRVQLLWDVIYGAFNLHDHRSINGVYKRRYRHLLPWNYNANAWSFTDTPYTARQVLDFIFGAPTVESPWSRVYHTLLNNPIFDLDFTSGQKLGQCLVAISQKVGLNFTLMGGPYNLVWALMGVGPVPDFPAQADNRRSGSSLSGNPTRVRILGDRNRYQVLNCNMERDWKPAWEAFWDFGLFINDIFLNEATDVELLAGPLNVTVPAGTPYAGIPDDPDHVIGYTLAAARARLLTVGQYATLRDRRVSGAGEAFRDYRRFQGRSRLNLPAALYLSQLLFRAFKLADTFAFRGASGKWINRWGYDFDGRPIVEVTHDPANGQMYVMEDGAGRALVPSSEGNGYAIVQGYQVGQDAFRSLNPDYFDYASWINAQALWQAQPFQVDDSGEGTQFIIFDEPVINSGDLITAAANAFPDGRARPVFNANPTFAIPSVRAAITMTGERFSLVQGDQLTAIDEVQNLAGLNGEFVLYSPANAPVEWAFADGLTASQKAASYAALLLNRQFYYQSGGYDLPGTDEITLSSLVNRITLRWNSHGLTKSVDWTTQRDRTVTVNPYGGSTVHLEPEQAFDRRNTLEALFPGQDVLRQESRQLRLTAAVLRSSPRMLRSLVDTFHLLMGHDSPPQTALLTTAGGTSPDTVPVGTPLYRDPAATVCWVPDDVGSTTHSAAVFVGITTMDAQSVTAGVRCTNAGAGGIVQARVMGPVALNAVVGMAGLAHTYLEATPSLPVGQVLEAITDAGVKLVRVRLGVGGGTTVASNYRGDWAVGVYNSGDETRMGDGFSAGFYRSMIDGNTNAPDTGIGWVQISSFTTWL